MPAASLPGHALDFNHTSTRKPPPALAGPQPNRIDTPNALLDRPGARAGAGCTVFVLQHPCASDQFLAADVRLAVRRGAGIAAGVAGAAARCTGPARAGAAMRGGCAAGGFAGQCRRPAAVLWPDRWLVGLAASRATGRGHGTAKAAQPAGLIAELGFVGVVVGGGAVHPRPG